MADKCPHGTPLGEDCPECRAEVERMKRDDPIEQIRRAHASARPTNENIAWQNCHHDRGVLLIEIGRLREALKMIADETLCPDLWREEQRKDWSEGELAHRTALVIALAALEPAHAK